MHHGLDDCLPRLRSLHGNEESRREDLQDVEEEGLDNARILILAVLCCCVATVTISRLALIPHSMCRSVDEWTQSAAGGQCRLAFLPRKLRKPICSFMQLMLCLANGDFMGLTLARKLNANCVRPPRGACWDSLPTYYSSLHASTMCFITLTSYEHANHIFLISCTTLNCLESGCYQTKVRRMV